MNKYKETILTSNFYGLLASFKLDRLSSCTILKSHDFNQLSFVTQLERNSYISFAKKHNLSIEEFFSSYDRVIHFNNTKVFLGSSTYVNVCEVYRKTGIAVDLSVITESEFNHLFKKYLAEIEIFLQRGESLEHQLYALSKRHYKVYDLISPLVDAYLNDNDVKELLLNNSQLISGRIYSNKVNQVEIIYYVLNLLSDYFRVDSKKLNYYLTFMLQNNKNNIYLTNSVTAYEDSVVIDKLVINHKKVYVCDQNINLSFSSKNLVTYSSLTISAKVLDSFKYYLDKVFYINNADSFGSSAPHVEVVFEQDRVYLKYFYKKELASKEHFYIDIAKKLLFEYSQKWNLEVDTDSIQTHNSELLYCNRAGFISNQDDVDSICSNEFNSSRYLNHTSSSNMYMGNSNSLVRLFKA